MLIELNTYGGKNCERFSIQTAYNKSRHNDPFQLEKNGTHYNRSDNSRFREHIYNKSRFVKSHAALPDKNVECTAFLIGICDM